MLDNVMWALYWIDVLSSFPGHIVGGFVTGVLIAAAVLIGHGIYNGECAGGEEIPGNAVRNRTIATFLIVLAVSMVPVFVPSKQTMHLMLGVKVTEGVVTSETGQKVQKILNSKLDEYLELIEKKEKK